jgi:hypothetical protein
LVAEPRLENAHWAWWDMKLQERVPQAMLRKTPTQCRLAVALIDPSAYQPHKTNCANALQRTI